MNFGQKSQHMQVPIFHVWQALFYVWHALATCKALQDLGSCCEHLAISVHQQVLVRPASNCACRKMFMMLRSYLQDVLSIRLMFYRQDLDSLLPIRCTWGAAATTSPSQCTSRSFRTLSKSCRPVNVTFRKPFHATTSPSQCTSRSLFALRNHPEDNLEANGWFLWSTPTQMSPPRGGRLT